MGLAVGRPVRTLSVEPFFMERIGGIESELAPRSIALMLQTVTSHDDVGPPHAPGSVPAVWSDDGASIRENVAYLATPGHRSIARVAGLTGPAHTTVRDDAFEASCRELSEPVVVHTDYSGEDGARATRSLLITPGRPTAIVYDHPARVPARLAPAEVGRHTATGW
ncbi:hypothetical protein [Streptomyces sp. NPDC016845]|uniref:hypothetical protein n=1 Tax=Streptomyces sp. NPDC016845 TaxID=3364972 RepID=UPI0037A0A75A